MALSLQHQTIAEFMTRLRESYRNSNKAELAKLAYWLYERFLAGDITQAQIRTAFNLVDDADWLTFRDRVIALHDCWQNVLAAQGE